MLSFCIHSANVPPSTPFCPVATSPESDWPSGRGWNLATLTNSLPWLKPLKNIIVYRNLPKSMVIWPFILFVGFNHFLLVVHRKLPSGLCKVRLQMVCSTINMKLICWLKEFASGSGHFWCWMRSWKDHLSSELHNLHILSPNRLYTLIAYLAFTRHNLLSESSHDLNKSSSHFCSNNRSIRCTSTILRWDPDPNKWQTWRNPQKHVQTLRTLVYWFSTSWKVNNAMKS